MPIDTADLRTALGAIRNDVRDLLVRLIAVPSTRGGERPATEIMHDALAPITDRCDYVQISESIQDDPDFSWPRAGVTYADRPDLLAVRSGADGGPTFFMNTHLDVVPPSVGQADPWTARQQDGVIFGRGACDAKGQAATIYAVLRALSDLGVRLPCSVEGHLVIEEENGGNGSVAMLRHLQQTRGVGCAAGCVVLEPSNLRIMPSVRGAMWFRLRVFGRPGHSGTPGSSVSALKKAVAAMAVLEDYHDRLLAASRGNPLFDRFENPMPVTFGICQAGNWPAAAPAEATLEGVFGFLPPKTRDDIRREMTEALATCDDPWLRENFELSFPMLHADGNELDPGHPLVRAIEHSLRDAGIEPELSALTGSCDARCYANDLQVPTVVFGPGDLGTAHGKDERVHLDDILTAAEVLIRTFERLSS